MRSGIVCVFLLLSLAQAKNYTCVPGQSCWPSDQQWAIFNQSIGGNLQVTVPLAAGCFPSSNFNQTQCKVIEQNYTVSQFRADNFGNLQDLTFERCGVTGPGCELDAKIVTGLPTNGTCELGSIAAYFVNATQVDHIIKTLAFVDQYSLRLSIKNTGHDYLGRSASPNSLALWTHNLKNMSYAENFTAYNCPAADSQGVGVIGAGTSAGEAVQFFGLYDRYITVGAVSSVGIAGGYGQGGGHGPLGPSVGLAVDNAVEFDVITADGQLRTINQCNEADLFHAMRGGGGSTYAILVNYKIQTHLPTLINWYAVSANVTEAPTANISQSKVWPVLIDSLIANQVTWSSNKIAGYHFFSNSTFSSNLILPQNISTAEFKALIEPYESIVNSLPNVAITKSSYTNYSSYVGFDNDFAGEGASKEAPSGIGGFLATRLISRTLFDAQTQFNDTTLKQTVIDGFSKSFPAGLGTQIYATGPANQPNNTATGVNPAWRGSLWGLYWSGGYVGGNNNTAWLAQASIADSINDAVKQITPGGGTYMNEASAYDPDWQHDFWGANYPRLLSIKQTYDPDNMFNCYKCVGWNGFNDDRYSCYTSNPQGSVQLGPVYVD